MLALFGALLFWVGLAATVLFAAAVWPLTFKFFAKAGAKK